jgi:O-antigen/teichoic acid export membrane protein
MSRFRNAARSLTSGYAALVANGFYILASVPLALRYLSDYEFALWNVVVQVGVNLLLIDFGITGAVARILIDHKDVRESGSYGSVIKTGMLVLLIQGGIIIIGGLVLTWFLPSLLEVREDYVRIFKLLIFGQCLLLGGFFVTRIFTGILQAHQRFDVINYAQILQLLAGFITQWFTFHIGWGLYSLLAASAANTAVGVLHNLIWVFHLRLFPSKGQWGRTSSTIFKEVFAFGKDLFVMAIGLQLLNNSQMFIIARTLDYTAVTVWIIATRTFLLAQQVVARISDFSSSALGEMIVRGERDRLRQRFRELLIITGSVAVFAGASVALCNGSFIEVWLKGGAHTINAPEIKDVRSFSSKLIEHADPVSQFVWTQFSESTREMIRTNTSTNALQTILVTNLNKLLTNSIYEPERFKTVVLSQDTKYLLNRNLHGGWLARLNRLLLEDAFPENLVSSIRYSSAWPWRNDVLLGLLLIVTSVTRCHIGLTGQTKQIGAMRFIYFLEGLTFVVAACLAAPRFGMTGIVAAAIIANILWSGAYGFWRTAHYFGIRVSEPLLAWLRPSYLYLLSMTPVTVLVAWGTAGLFIVPRFFVSATILFFIGSTLLWIIGLNTELRRELKQRLKPR